MAGLSLLSNKNDPNIEIKAPTLDATRITSYFAAVAAIAAPVLTWITGQEESVRQTALMITLVAIPSVAFVVAADIVARSYVEAHRSEETNSEEDASSVAPSLAFASSDVRVRVSGEGQDAYRLLGARWDPKEGKWLYWVGRSSGMKWVEESKVDELVL